MAERMKAKNAVVETVPLYGIHVSKMNMEQTVDYLTAAVAAKEPTQVITANPIMFMDALEDANYMAMMQTAELIVPDGTGLVWAAKKVGQPVAERVAGYDLLHRLMERGKKTGWRVFLLGSAPDIVQTAADRLHTLYPGIQIVGVRDGFFTSEQDEEVIAELNTAQPDVLFVANSAKRQDLWIHKYKSQLNIPIMMGVGGSFDIIAGKLKRAPRLFQQLRLEWFYRLLQEPWRFKRMLVLPQFVWKVFTKNPLKS